MLHPGPPRRAETLPVRFAGVGRDDPEPRILRPGERAREIITERPATETSPEPILRRQGSSFRETRQQQPAVDVRDFDRDEPWNGHRQSHRRKHRQRDHSSGRINNSGLDEDSRKSGTDSSESDGSSDSSNDSLYYGRPPRILRYSRNGYSSESESEEERDVNRDTYAFSLPRYGRSPLSQDSTLVGSDLSIKTEADSVSQVAVDGPKLGAPHYVYRSQYTGERSVGGFHSAQLTVIHDPKKGRPPLFRWM
jgi:hypothetical protein